MFKDKKVPTLSALSWSHYVELLPIKDINEIEYYVNKACSKNLGVRELRTIIKTREYENLPDDVKEKLRENQELELKETIADPIIIPNPKDIEIIKEKEL